jgi:hypothetical protein
MRKRFVRLALIAAVVLVAFLLYKNTEGFVVASGTQYTCGKPGAAIAINKRGKLDYYICAANTTIKIGNKNVPNKLENPNCGNFKMDGGWKSCVGLPVANSKSRMCHVCRP